MRGLLDPKGDSGQIDTLNRLRNAASAQECHVINNTLYDHQLFKHLKLSEEFPKTPTNFELHMRMSPQPIQNELICLSHRLEKNQKKIEWALDAICILNAYLADDDLVQAISVLEEIESSIGCSYFLLIKLTYIYTRIDHEDAAKEICAAMLDRYGLSQNNLVVLSLADTMGENYSLFSVRKNILNISERGTENRFTNDLARFVHLPLCYTAQQFHQKLQSFTQSSLLDAAFFFSLHRYNVKKSNLFEAPQDVLDTIDNLLRDKWLQISQQRVVFTNLMGRDEVEADYRFYRQSLAWIELEKVSVYRNAMDRYYRDYEDKALLPDQSGKVFLTEYFANLSSPQQLIRRSFPQKIDLSKFSLQHSGIFSRTMAFIHILEKTEGNFSIDSDDFLAIMGVTRDLAEISNRTYLSNIAEKNSDILIKFVVKCLISRRSRNDADAFLLRRLIQEIVAKDFDGSVPNFIKFLDEKSTAVATFVYEMCDEAFLSQLFRLFPTTDDFFECRAKLHEWYGKRHDEPILVERAKTLRIDLRLQKIRGEIDDTRIYVDPNRYTEWLQDNCFTELSSILRSQRLSLISRIIESTSGELTSQKAPEARLASLIQTAFSEFYGNTKFGIASYLGRRIRHGTLKGVMLSPVQSLINDEKFQRLFETGDSSKIVRAWLNNYIRGTEVLGRDVLQISSNKKTNGLFETNIYRRDRAEILSAAIIDIDKTYAETRSFTHVNAKFYSYCWRLADKDLRRVREHLGNCRQEWGTFNAAEFRRSVVEGRRQLASTFTRELNSLLDERFRIVISWFNEPTNLSPSAPLNLLFDAVLAEVLETFSDFSPTMIKNNMNNFQLSGGTYHLVYDALYVVVYNAAKHGKKNGELAYNFRFDETILGNKELVVTISSEITNGMTDKEVDDNIKNAMLGRNDDALVVEGRSGFKKLMRMEHDSKEMTGFQVCCKNGKVEVTCRYGLVY